MYCKEVRQPEELGGAGDSASLPPLPDSATPVVSAMPSFPLALLHQANARASQWEAPGLASTAPRKKALDWDSSSGDGDT